MFQTDLVQSEKLHSDGNVTTFAGSGSPGSTNGQGHQHSFNKPFGFVVDTSGKLYEGPIMDHVIRKIDLVWKCHNSME